MDFACYHVFENEISGEMWGPMGPMAGTGATRKMYEDSFLMTFSFYPEG